MDGVRFWTLMLAIERLACIHSESAAKRSSQMYWPNNGILAKFDSSAAGVGHVTENETLQAVRRITSGLPGIRQLLERADYGPTTYSVENLEEPLWCASFPASRPLGVAFQEASHRCLCSFTDTYD
jgi:hypothetical protein